MTVRGDLAATLVSHYGFEWAHAVDVVDTILKSANDPNFAFRYAREEADNNKTENDLMCEYWAVVKFLKWTNQCHG